MSVIHEAAFHEDGKRRVASRADRRKAAAAFRAGDCTVGNERLIDPTATEPFGGFRSGQIDRPAVRRIAIPRVSHRLTVQECDELSAAEAGMPQKGEPLPQE